MHKHFKTFIQFIELAFIASLVFIFPTGSMLAGGYLVALAFLKNRHNETMKKYSVYHTEPFSGILMLYSVLKRRKIKKEIEASSIEDKYIRAMIFMYQYPDERLTICSMVDCDILKIMDLVDYKELRISANIHMTRQQILDNFVSSVRAREFILLQDVTESEIKQLVVKIKYVAIDNFATYVETIPLSYNMAKLAKQIIDLQPKYPVFFHSYIKRIQKIIDPILTIGNERALLMSSVGVHKKTSVQKI